MIHIFTFYPECPFCDDDTCPDNDPVVMVRTTAELVDFDVKWEMYRLNAFEVDVTEINTKPTGLPASAYIEEV